MVKRERPKQHLRHLKSGKVVIINRGINRAISLKGEFSDPTESAELRDYFNNMPKYQVSPEEEKSIETYFEDSDPINIPLRNEEKVADETIVHHLDSVIARNSLEKNCILYRSVSKRTAAKVFTTLERGDSYTDLGFCSTSINRDHCRRSFGSRMEDERYELKIQAKAGTPAIYIPKDGVKDAPQIKQEKEVLLGRNTRFNFVGKTNVTFQSGNKQILIHQITVEIA